VLGIIGILLINLFQKTKQKTRYKSKQNIFQLMLAGTSLGMTSILLFSRKIYSCFHWDCIVDAKRMWGVTRNVLRKEFLLSKVVAVIIVLLGLF
jgi:hypothetical protein